MVCSNHVFILQWIRGLHDRADVDSLSSKLSISLHHVQYYIHSEVGKILIVEYLTYKIQHTGASVF